MLFNIFVEEQTQSTIQDLYKLLDEVTPLYKHRMDDLKPNQQKIVYEVAMNWDGISVKELAEKTKMESKTVSAQLNLLSKNQIIEKVKTDTKNNFYRLQERFLNIWYLMRLGNKRQHDRVVWLVRFLDNWCNEDEMQRRVDLFLKDQEIAKNIKELLNEVYLKSEKVPLQDKQKILAKYGEEIPFSEHIKYMATDKFPYENIMNEFENNIELFESICRFVVGNYRWDIIEEIQEKVGLEKIMKNESTKKLTYISLLSLCKYDKLLELKKELKISRQELEYVLQGKLELDKLYEFFKTYESMRIFYLLNQDLKYLPIPTISYYVNKLSLSEKIKLYLLRDSNLLHKKIKIFFNKKSFSEIYKEITQKGLYNEFQLVVSVKIEGLLSEEKYFIANKFIREMELKEIMKPHYYATQYFLDNTQEVKRMGSELQEAFDGVSN